MTNAERDALLVRIDEQIEEINKALERDYHALHGNGHPGLVSRVQKLEDWQEQAESFKQKYGSVIGWIITTAIAVFAVFKPHEQ